LRASHTVFGREEETVFITGYSGLGKSALVSECIRLLSVSNSVSLKSNQFLIAEGKFLQYNKTPYNGLIRLFQNMLQNAAKDHGVEPIAEMLKSFQPIEILVLSQFVPGILGVLGIESPELSANSEFSDTYSRVVPT